MTVRKVTLENGKYAIEFDEYTGKLEVFRHGSLWGKETGNKFLLCMMQRIEELQEKEEELNKKLNEAVSLLDDAHTVMGDSHCYDNDVYSEIDSFIYNHNKQR
ncbi:ribonucleoside-diphosphate reductase subunit beta [Bacillus phage BCPG3]|uniref:Uncharacterized protein n=1 Tax=Bacillus phage SalinJah TaxID=1837830 RepID=A0A173GBM8_9CAUD|nr:hypothetical protein SALINJAH_136 [Bacillus phage SalinJah]ANH50603.1 hypothetical protein SALINJAH_136 [Bacillus phage SalinJah]QQO38796.1 hypothetical protein BCPG1_064 [Bacillus phage BCPG1]QSJ04505.1 ribonucleoside-diphosphate reductase subunit beta [Bacillus phage BCPG3]QSJ04714.1 hypothetical protein BCP18_182 [Bacillus phage BCP18]